MQLKPEDKDFLAQYTMKDLHNTLKLEPDTLTVTQQNFISLFNTYYYGHEVIRDINND